MNFKKTLVAMAALAASAAALADVNVGVSLALTGPGSGLGIPMQKQLALFPKEIAGEKLNVIVLDDATDPTKAVQNTRKFINEDKVDVIIGSVATPVAAAMADVAAEGKTVMLITHSVEEALFLATRLIVMSPSPGRISHVYDDVPFSRQFLDHGDSRRVKSEPAFIALREEVLAFGRQKEKGATAVITMGANPGLASAWVKQALMNLAADRGLEELADRRGEEQVTLAWLADQMQAFVDQFPDFEVPVERLATWLARGGADPDEDLED